MRQKGRKVPVIEITGRKQYAPGQLRNSLHPNVCYNIEQLALVGYEQKGRGFLIVEVNDHDEGGIANAEYIPIMELSDMARTVPFGEMQPLSEAVKSYDPAVEFVGLVINATQSLPAPQMWFEIFPRGAQPEE